MSEDVLTPAEVAKVTGKSRAASQAAVLAKLGIPFAFLGRSVKVARTVALAFELLPKSTSRRGIDLSSVR